MKILKSLFHFLGGIHLAITLIAVAAITAVVGTLLESITGSHLLAARWTYENPFFLFLLSLFFVNILFAALRKWPFKKRHFPFLITHLGLLMMISGTMIKNRFGLQGQLTVWEGSGNHKVLLPHTYSLLIEEKGELTNQNSMIALDSFRPDIYYPFYFPQLKCKVIGYAPHVKEELETWIKGTQAYIAGFPPIPVHEWKPSEVFPEAGSYHFKMATNFSTWSILALRTSHVKEALQHAYLQNLTLQFRMKGDTKKSFKIPLQQALQDSFSFMQGNMHTLLDLPLPLLEKEAPSLNFAWKSQEHSKEEKFIVPLQGQDALLVKPNPTHWSEASFIVDLIRPHPLLCAIEDEQGNTFLFAFDTHGRMHGESFSSSNLQTIVAYDQGFGGYGVQATVPIPSFFAGREDKEKADAYALTMQLQQVLTQQPPLAPPLHLFKQACQRAQVDFPKAFVQFLIEWNSHPGFLYCPIETIPEPLHHVFKYFNWKDLSSYEKQAAQWTFRLLNQLEESWKQGDDPLHVLERHHWPFVEELKQTKASFQTLSLLNTISQQISSLVDDLPSLDFPLSLSDSEQASLLSAYFRVYGIDYRSLFPYQGNGKEQFDSLEKYWGDHSENQNLRQAIVFETPLSHRVIPDAIPSKPEDQCPGIVIEVQEGQNKHTIALVYASSGGGLKWPILNGNYIVRFQPKFRELPYRLRLRQARQITYPQSQQIYSYESDLLISEKGKSSLEQTLSMNRVYETWDGYRFYLAGIGNSADSSLKRIQLAVNYDPAKYFLTYPGAALVFLGAILLFWIYPRKK